VVIGAGEYVNSVQTWLARRGERLAVDPPSRFGTVGGMLAMNESGPLRYRYGTPADQIVSIRHVDETGGVHQSAGGPGVATVNGIITTAVMRVSPLPAARRYVVCPVATPAQVGLSALEVIFDEIEASAIETDLPAGGQGTTAVLLEGDPDLVEAQTARVLAAWGPEAEARAAAPAWWGRYPFGPDDVVLRLQVSRADLTAAVYACRDACGGPVGVRGSAGLGDVHAVLPPGLDPERIETIVDTLRTVLMARGGRVDIVAAPPRLAGLF
jgi:glycolate oxidase FAD binding subunit